VRDDIVQLARDPRALLGDRVAGARVALDRQLLGAALERVLALAAVAHVAPDEERAAKQDDEEGDVRRSRRVAGLDRGQPDPDHHQRDGDDERASARVAPRRVDGQQYADQERGSVRQRGRGQVRQLDDHDRDRERDKRRAPAPHQRSAEHERRGEADRAIAGEVRFGRDLDAIGHGDGGRDQEVAIAGR
jgi:hypothetical protein